MEPKVDERSTEISVYARGTTIKQSLTSSFSEKLLKETQNWSCLPEICYGTRNGHCEGVARLVRSRGG